MYPNSPWRVIVVEIGATERLDTWLTAVVPGLSRRIAGAMIARGDVTINRRRSVKSEPVILGSTVEIWSAPTLSMWKPNPDSRYSLTVLYLDEHIAVVEKPSGISSVPLGQDEMGTLANFVVARFPECAGICRRSGDGGLLQRLDFETSGAVMVARSQVIHDTMIAAQQRGEIEKRYLALVRGEPPSLFSIDTPLAKTGAKGSRMRPQRDGIVASTEVRLISRHGDWTLVEAVIYHGVRHQIRVHLASEGFPIAKDSLYSDGKGPPGLGRLFLHAHTVSFIHPIANGLTSAHSPLPGDLGGCLGV